MVKLTAQFVARNGRQFLTNLMNREQRNYLFDFLRPQHSMFNYFTKLVEQYTKVQNVNTAVKLNRNQYGIPANCPVLNRFVLFFRSKSVNKTEQYVFQVPREI